MTSHMLGVSLCWRPLFYTDTAAHGSIIYNEAVSGDLSNSFHPLRS